MKQLKRRLSRTIWVVTCTGIAQGLIAQWSIAPGTPFLQAGVPSANVGTNATTPSLLTISGHQLGSGEVFRTNSEWFTGGATPYGTDSHWRMYRATNGGVNNFGMEMGEIYSRNNAPGDLNTNLGFNIQGKRQNGGVWLRNHRGRPNYDGAGQILDNDEPRGNGLRLIDDSTRAGGGLSLNAYTGISRIGYVAIGHALNMDESATSGEMIMPWTRLHLVDGFGWPGETPYPLDIPEWMPYRPFCRNGVSFSGNSTYAYLGHKYALRDYPHDGNSDDLVPDSSDMVALWGNDRMLPGGSHWNNFTFRFSLAADGLYGGASEFEGLEIMRLRPHKKEEGSRVEGFVGIGDFVNSYPEVPEERLDVLDKTIRIRSLGVPAQYHNNSLDRVLVVDSLDGRVYWRYAYTIGSGGGSGCNWNYVPSANRMYTAFDPVGAGSCPQKDWLVGIGESVPKTKLDVYAVRSLDNSTGAIHGLMKANTSGVVQSGLVASVEPETSGNTVTFGIGSDASATDINKGYGARGTVNLVTSGLSTTDAFGTYGYVNAAGGTANNVVGARGEVQITGGTIDRYVAGTYGLVNGPSTGSAAISYGMFGLSYGRGTITGNSYGGYGQAYSYSGSVADSYGLYGISTAYADNLISGDSYGVRGAAWHGTTGNYSVYGDNPGTGSNDWSGYFPGRTYVAGTTYVPSDENLKENIAPVENATAQLMQLDPKQYQYLCEAFPHMGLPQGTRYGFIAQQFAQQFPNMVTNAHQPAELDSLGQVVHPAVDFMAISTGDLTPLIVAGFKEQQAVIVGLQEAVAQLQEQLAACCVNGGDSRMLHTGPSTTGAMETDLRIIPNPVADRTELRYTVANAGRVRLEITDATGRKTLVQDEGARTAGSHVYEWNTTLLAPGTYHCTLYVNDERLVEKAVKLNAR